MRGRTMRVSDIVQPELIRLNLAAISRDEAIAELTGLLAAQGKLVSAGAFQEAVLAREALGPTGVGLGIAIPHGKSTAVRQAAVAVGRSKGGIYFGASDGTPAHLIFLIAAPDSADNLHLKVLAQLSRMLMDEGFRSELAGAGSVEEFMAAIARREGGSQP